MDKINPSQYLTSFAPVPEEVIDASGWFETEHLELKQRWSFNSNTAWGPYIGNYLPWFLSQGWVVRNTTTVDVGARLDVYEYTYTLARRKLQSELVLQTLITDFTKAYNEGRQVNSGRYEELVTLYSVMLDNSEGIFGADKVSDDAYEGLIETLIGQIGSDSTEFSEDMDGILDGYGDSMRLQINARFDSQLSTARQDLVTRGMYGSTLWDSISAGIERERSLALTDLEDKITQQTIGVTKQIYEVKASARSGVIAARDRLHAKIREASDQRMATRNAILSAMLSFMERRQDDYPDLANLADIAARLGYGDSPNTVMP